ncbi:MAG: sigma-70 family RNA polymerase sigma factor [Leptospirales bacterium]|nr:sigma-70 family RNA polymerase sigma factor [Leptospirales bacterium]
MDTLHDARSGDEQAWRRLVVACHQPLLRRCIRHLHGHHENARESIGDFWEFCFAKNLLLKFRGNTIYALSGFLGVCLRNFLLSKPPDLEIADQDYIDRVAVEQPARALEENETKDLILSAVEHLRVEYRTVIVLEMQRYKQREIATMLSRPLNTISSFSRRAKILLKDQLLRKGVRLSA